MTAQHTPGPWKIHDGGRFGQYGDLGPSICHPTSETTCQPLFEIVGPANIEECQANAVLVESAPDLLDLATSVSVWLMSPDLSRETLDYFRARARAAIAKATRGKP